MSLCKHTSYFSGIEILAGENANFCEKNPIRNKNANGLIIDTSRITKISVEDHQVHLWKEAYREHIIVE